jgi:transaldolase / glucose-6-phosphate isomerase
MVTAVGTKAAGRHFVPITDPGSKIQRVAESDGFRDVFLGWPDIGGPYAVLSPFGLVPAANMGIDVAKLLDRSEEMVSACMPCVPVEDNPGVVLGTVLGVAASQFGRDKVTIVASPGIDRLGMWLEYLIAESTGKDGNGLIPIDRERLGTPLTYGDDRLFVHLRLTSMPSTSLDAAVQALALAGQPVIHIALDDAYDVGKEFFRWGVATAVAGAILGVHPFDRPDVEASTIAARRLTEHYEQTGALPVEAPIFAGIGIELFADDRNAAALAHLMNGQPDLAAYLHAHLVRARERDYVGLLAYLEMGEATVRALRAMRHRVRETTRVATMLEF